MFGRINPFSSKYTNVPWHLWDRQSSFIKKQKKIRNLNEIT